MREPAGGAVALAGALLVLVAAVGLHRFGNPYARMHAAGKSASLGIALVLAGAALAGADGAVPGRLLLAGAFLFVTFPVSTTMLARAIHASRSGHEETLVADELADAEGVAGAAGTGDDGGASGSQP